MCQGGGMVYVKVIKMSMGRELIKRRARGIIDTHMHIHKKT